MKQVRIFNKIMSVVLAMVMVVSMLPMSVFAADPVAKVGNTEYATIDEAIANWTNGTTLTLLDDVTLSDVVTLKSTEHHILNLGTYTMTAASGKNAFVIQACGNGSAERSVITIDADATNPGGINAGNKCVVYYKYADGGISTEDRPIIKINGGVFTGSTSSVGAAGIYTIGTAARKCATVNITGGTFNCSIVGSSKSKLIISGGTFNYSVSSQGDSTALRLISGGTFKTLGFMTADSNNTKFWIGTSMGNSNVGAYVDDNGYIVIGGPVVTEAGETFEASANYSGASSYLQYSSAKDNGLYYTSVEEAFADNNKAAGSVTVYVDELDMTGINYKGTIVVPEGESITITVAEGTDPTWTVDGAENAVTYVNAAGEKLVKGEDGFTKPTQTLSDFVAAVIAANGNYDGQGATFEITPASGNTQTDTVEGLPDRLQKYSNPEVYYAQYQRFAELTDVSISNVNFKFVPAAVTVKDAWNTAGATTTADNINGELQLLNNGSVTLTGCTFDQMSVSPISATSVIVSDCEFTGLDAYAIKDIKASTVSVTDSTFTDCSGAFWMSAAPATLTVTDNDFVNVGRRGAIQFSAAGDYTNTAMDVTGNTVTGGALLWQLNSTVTYEQVSAILDTTKNTYETAYVGGSIEPAAPAPTSTLTNCYTSDSGYWGECGGNASESFVFKFYNGDTYMGYTSLNNVGGIIDGDVYVSFSIKLDAESNDDPYWTMAWEIQPTLDMQPTRVEHWVDGVKAGEAEVEPNWSDSIFPVVAAVTDENDTILSYVNGTEGHTLADAVANGGYITLLADVKLDNTLTIEKSLTLDGNGHKLTPKIASAYNSAIMAGNSLWGDDHGETIVLKDLVFEGWTTTYGVVRAQGVTLEMDGCEFNSCSAEHYAYGVLSLNYADATVSNTEFTGNTGKAIDINYNADDTNAVVNIDKCAFTGNTTTGAGIVMRSDGTMNLTNSTFTGNAVNTDGNAATVYVGFGTGHAVTGCTFTDNTVTSSNATTKRVASAIFCDGCEVTGNVFGEGNTATRNGEAMSTVAVGAYYGPADVSGNYWNGGEPDYAVEYTNQTVANDSYYTKLNADGTIDETSKVVIATAVAIVDGVEYTDLQEAIVAAAPSGTVELLSDVTVDKWVMISETLSIGNGNIITIDSIDGLTIDGNNHTLTINSIESASNGNRLFYDATALNVQDLTIKYAEGLGGGIGLKSGTISNVTFDGGVYGILPQTGDVTITGCTFMTNGTSIYFEEERDGLTVTGNTFENPDEVNVILLRGDVTFTGNTVISGRTVNVVSGSPVVTGNNFNDVRFKVYNEATATIENNTINNLVFNDDTAQQSTFTNNIMSESAQAALDAVTPTGLEGAGTAEEPFIIADIDDLKWFRDDVNKGNTYDNQFVKLTGDIDLSGENWTPIGNGTNKFLGTFDGDEHTISNLKVEVTGNNAGLFGFASVIKNVTINNANVSGVICVGALVGELESSVGTLDNCHVTGNIKITGENSVGGLAGKGYANIKNCTVTGDGVATSFVLGVAGNTEEGDNIGGIIGHLGEGNTLGVANSTAKNIKVMGTRKVGGIVGTTARANDYVGNTVDGVTVECTATAEYADDNASTTTIGGIVGNYFGSATSGGILQDSTVKNVTFVVGNAKSAGALAGGDRENGGGAPVGVEASGSTVENVTGATNNYLMPVVAEVNGVQYPTLEEAAAAAQAGDEIVLIADATLAGELTLPAGIILNGNGKQINGNIVAGGDLTFKGHTKVTSFNAGYTKPTITIGEGACLEMNGSGRMVIGHGATFNITGTIEDAKSANTADLTPSLIMPGASFTGAGVTFNVTNAYIKTTASYCSSSSSASGTFDFNITNSVWEQFGKLAFESQSTAATVNFELKESVLTTSSHLVFGVSRGEVVIDNSNVNVGTSRQIENQSTMTVKNGSVVNGAVATSSNAKNPGTLIVDNATYAVTGEFSGAELGTGTLIVKKGASFTAGSITKANIVVDATGMAAGDEINITANLSKFAGTLEVTNNDGLTAEIVDGKIVLVEAPVAEVNGVKYATLEEAFKAATSGCVINILTDVTVDYYWDCRYTGSKFTVPVTINGNDHTLTFTNTVYDAGNHMSAFRFEADAEVNDLTIDMTNAISGFQGRFRAISAKGNLTVDNCTFIGNGSANNTRAIIFGEGGTADSLANVAISVTNSDFTGWRQAIIDNESGKTEVKTVTITGNTMTDAGVNVSAFDSITFTGNMVEGKYVKLVSYTADNALNVTATGNTLTANADTSANCNYIKAGGTVEAQDEFVVHVEAVAEVNGEKFATLQAAIDAAQDGDTVTVLDNITVTDTISISNKNLEIDGGEKTITFDMDAGSGISVSGTAAVVIKNATFTGHDVTGGNNAAITAVGTGATLTLENCVFTGNSGDHAVHANAAVLNIDGCMFDDNDCAGQVVVSGVNGTNNTVAIKDSTFTNNDVTGSGIIYFGDAGTKVDGMTLSVENCTFTNNTVDSTSVAVVYLSTAATVNGNLFEGNTITSTNGTGDDRCGVIILGGGAAGAIVNGNAFVNNTLNPSTNKYAIICMKVGANLSNNYWGDGEAPELGKDIFYTTWFKPTISSYAVSYTANSNGQGVTVATAVAAIGNVSYPTLAEAVAAAQAGETVTVLTDIELTETLKVAADKNVTLDLNGKTITYNVYRGAQEQDEAILNLGTLVIADSSTAGTGKITSYYDHPANQDNSLPYPYPTYGSNTITNQGNLTVKGGTIECNTAGDAAFAIDNGSRWSNAKLVIEGGKVVHTVNNKSGAIRVCSTNTTYTNELVMTGGEVEGRRGITVQLAGANGDYTKKAQASVVISGGTITSTDTNAERYRAVYSWSDGIAYDQVSITVKGDAVLNGNLHVGDDYKDGMTGAETVAIEGGTIKGEVKALTPEHNIAISGGTFNVEPNADYVADGFTCEQNEDGTYGIVEAAYVAEVNGEKFETVAAALAYAKEAGITDLTITLIGETTKESAIALEDSFDLMYSTAFDSVTFKQADASKVYYIDTIYTGDRTNGGEFVFDGVNICVISQYMFEGNVRLTNNSVVKSVAEANCFFYYCTTTIEPGSKLDGVIEDFRGGDVIVDGGKTDGTYADEPGLRDAIMTVRWSGDSLTLKNGAYVKINSANEIGQLNIEPGTSVNVYASKLDAWQWIAVKGTLNTDVGSVITTKAITGAGKIVIDATGFDGDEVKVITADMSGFTGTIEVTGGYEATSDATGVTVTKAAKQPSGEVAYRAYIMGNDSTRENIQIDLLNIYAENSLVVKMLDANGNLLTTTTYRSGAIEATDTTCNVVLAGRESGSWATEIHTKLTVANVPATIEVWADDVLTDTYTNALGAGTGVDETADYMALNCVYKAAEIDGTYYATLADAFAAAEDGDTIKLVADVELNEMITNSKKVTLDLNGKTITGTDTTEKNFSLIDNRGNLTIKDSDGNGKMTLTATVNSGWSRYSAVIANNPGGKFTLESGTLEHLGGTDMAYGIDNLTNGKGTYAETVVNGGTVKSPYRAIRQFLNGVEAQNILTVNGGTIEGANKSIWMQDPSANANTGTLTVGENAVLKGDVYLFVTAGSTEWPVEVSIAAAALGESELLTGNVPEGYEVKLTDGTWGVVEVTYVAQIGDVKYADLQAAIDAAQAGETIVLLDNLTIVSDLNNAAKGYFNIEADKEVAIDLNGKTIDVTDNSAGNFILFYNYGELTMMDNVGGAKVNLNSTINRAWNAQSTIVLNRGGVLTVEGGEYNHLGGTDMAITICNSGNSFGDAYLYVNGGTITSTYTAVRMRMADPALNGNPGNGLVYMTVTGGTIKGETRGIWGQITNATTEALGALDITGGTIEGGTNAIKMTADESANINVTISGDAMVKGAVEGESADFAITGGTFTTDVTELCAEGFTCKANGDGTYGIVAEELFEITKTNMAMGQNLKLLFAFEQSCITDEDLSDYVAKVSVEYKDDRGTVETEIAAADWARTSISGVAYWAVTVSNLAAKEMDDKVTVTICKGDEAVSKPKTTSLLEYGMDRLVNSTDDLFKTTVVDMLNYGAEAQLYFKYNTENLANRELTDEQKSLATTEVTLDKTMEIISGPAEHFVASNVRFQSDITMLIAIDRASEAVSAKITFQDHKGNPKTAMDETPALSEANGTPIKAFEFTGMVVADIDQIITAEFFDAEGNVVLSLTDSLDAYLGRLKNTSSMYDLAIAFGKFSTSAYAFLHK